MRTLATKPKLLFFQHKYDERIPAFLLAHKREHVKCLSNFFDVTLIDDDSDYGRLCDIYEPDLALFESGVPFPSCRKPKLINTAACPQVPKVGFLNADAFCCGRSGFLSDMDKWGIETFVSIATTAAEHTPAIAGSLFVWPNFIDDDTYRDYALWKSVPVLFTGNKTALYPWRKAIFRRVSPQYPSLICPHFGYAPQKATTQVSVGEAYARLLNSSWFVPACGTVAKEVVRKHFEVPGCKACLVAENSPMLEAAGFLDMVNCVFADADSVLDKLEHLFQNPVKLGNIIDAGYNLVHTRHTIRHRDQVLQWLRLRQRLKPGHRIVQLSPFEPLRMVSNSFRVGMAPISSGGLIISLLREADRCLRKGEYKEAEDLYLTCCHYIPYMPEPQVRLALCSLYKGNAKQALSWILKPLDFTLGEYGAVDPDPIEWAYLIISLLCLGRVSDAVERGREFIWLRHPELDRARWVASVLHNHGGATTVLEEAMPHCRASLHQLPSRTMKDWVREVCLMLKACGRSELAESLTAASSRRDRALRSGESRSDEDNGIARAKEVDSCDLNLGGRTAIWRRAGVVQMFRWRTVASEAQKVVRCWIKSSLHGLELRFGYFLPYHLSERRNDECFEAVQALVREECIKAALIVGAARGKGCTEAILTGMVENSNRPAVFCISESRRWHGMVGMIRPDYLAARWYYLMPSYQEGVGQIVRSTVRTIKDRHHINAFDLVLIDGSEVKHQLDVDSRLCEELSTARFVILDDINICQMRDIYDHFLTSTGYVLEDQNTGLRNGYAIFAKVQSRTLAGGLVKGG